jgi:AcrR family transcriptional regulator
MNVGAGKSDRRMGPVGSDNWHAMLDGAEQVLRDEGHASLTSRRIAERVGVKQRLVYYYFSTMEDLVIALFKRLSERELERLQTALRSPLPLRAIWDICTHTADGRIISELMALANRIPGLRDEVTRYIRTSRAIEAEAIKAALVRLPKASTLSPEALAIFATSVALTLIRERQLGIDMGHAQAIGAIEAFLSAVEPEPSRANGGAGSA